MAVSNPTQAGAPEAARFFTATSETEAVALLDRLRARYAVVDRQLVFALTPAPGVLFGEFDALVSWAGRSCLALIGNFTLLGTLP